MEETKLGRIFVVDEFPGIEIEFKCPLVTRRCHRCKRDNYVPDQIDAFVTCEGYGCSAKVYANESNTLSTSKFYGDQTRRLPRCFGGYRTLG